MILDSLQRRGFIDSVNVDAACLKLSSVVVEEIFLPKLNKTLVVNGYPLPYMSVTMSVTTL